MRIPLSEPQVGEREAEYLRQCVAENWVASKGRFVREFEDRFAAVHGHEHAVSASSGTAALHLACLALGLGPGDEVLVPALTFAASAWPVRYTGATPVFVDVEPATFNLSADAAAAAITERTRAILVVHLYGHPADMDAIGELARRHDLAIVEDATEALGSRHHGRLCGTLGDIGCFSFNGNKVITAGGGGMVLARDEDHLDRMRHLSLQSREPGSAEYHHDELGFNYTLSNLQAAVGLAQLERLGDLLARRRELAARYERALHGALGLTFTAEPQWAHANYWLMSVLTDPGASRDRHQLMADLAAVNIEARPFFTPLPHIGAFAAEHAGAEIPVAVDLHHRGVSIPSSASMDDSAQDRVIAALKSAE